MTKVEVQAFQKNIRKSLMVAISQPTVQELNAKLGENMAALEAEVPSHLFLPAKGDAQTWEDVLNCNSIQYCTDPQV